MLSVVVPATNSPPTLGRCIDAIRASLPAGGELIVQREPRGAGPAAARNAGAARARGEVLVFVDADVVVDPRALGLIAGRFRDEPGLGALFGAYDEHPEAPGPVSRFRNLLHHHVHVRSAGVAETFWTGLGAVRTGAFRAVGGFDAARYPRAAVEDVELGLRLRTGGFAIELDPRVRGTHLKAWTLRSMLATDFARRGVPWVRLALERRELPRTLNAAPRQRAAAASALAVAVALGARRPALALAGTAGMVASNLPLYALLARSDGPGLALAGVPLHGLHLLTAVASVPAGAVLHAIGERT